MRERESVLMRIWGKLFTEHFQSATCLVLGLVEQECKNQRIQDLQGENSRVLETLSRTKNSAYQ